MPTTRKTFPGLDSSVFQHPLDREATLQLRKLAGFDAVVAKFIELRYEKLLYVFNIASSIQVNERQFPRIYAMLKESCAILDLPEPALYIQQNPSVNAFTFGHNNPFMVLYTGLLELMTDDEIMAVIAHELGHIKAGHVLYLTMASSIRDLSAVVGQLTLGIGSLVLVGIEAALINWRRRAELSADRASLLVMQDPAPVISVLAKLSGGSKRFADELSADAFLDQARAFDAELEKGLMERFYRMVAELTQGNHPFTVERAKELKLWSEGEAYQRIMNGDYLRPDRKIKINVQA
ncbi:MAG: M48 family metallopeptidase [Anaerolineae bacterium]|nr:M48 family metallopeptidase [Anaerolineae bacterium]